MMLDPVSDGGKRMTRKKRHKKYFGLGRIFLIILIISGIFINRLFSPVTISQEVGVTVPPKATTTGIAGMLFEEGLVRSPWAFKVYSKIMGFDGHLKTGEYRFSGVVTLKKIGETMSQGRIVTESFTVPEGYTVEQIADLLADKGIVDREEFLNCAQNGVFKYDYLPPPGSEHRLEGFLFPDTYKIARNSSEERIIKTMLERFDQVFSDVWRKEATKMGWPVVKVVTLASIIEREAKVPGDRPLISSVFHNRIKRGMRLESCATVQYALGKVKEVLLYDDLKIDSPYNTYIHDGLPPGPIASPGAASLEAALYPSSTNYLYFVAKKDGSHYFSKTLAEHNQAKRKYLK